jgi:chromate reductase
MTTPRLLGLSGSLRAQSCNSKLIREAARLFGECSFSEADLRFSLYDGDEEDANGVPENVQAVERQIADADAVVISTTEYNKGPSGVLKNALDWISRCEGNCWAGKPVAVMSAAAGRAGGERAQLILRSFMVPFRPRILQGPEIHVASCATQFDDQGRLTGEIYLRELGQLMQQLRAETTC